MNGLSRSQTDSNADKAINIQVALTSVFLIEMSYWNEFSCTAIVLQIKVVQQD